MRMRHTSNRHYLDNRADERMKEVQACIKGIRSPSAARICLLIEFCYLLDLHRQAVELYERLDRNQVEADWLSRVDKIAGTSRMRVRSQAAQKLR